MDLLFLGTSAGAPTKARNVSATALLEATGKRWYLIDCGEGTQHRLLHTPLSTQDLGGIFITHVHGDHCLGLPGLLASASMNGRRQPLNVVLPRALHEWLRISLAVTDSHLSFDLRLLPVEDFNGWHNAAVTVSTVTLSHRVPSVGYLFEERCPEPRLDSVRLDAEGVPRGPLWGTLAKGLAVSHQGRELQAADYLRPGRAARRIIVCGDNDTPELLAEAAAGADVLVHEATFTQPAVERSGVTYGHSTAAAVARFAQAAGVRNLVLTHFSARYQADNRRSPSIDDVRQEAALHYAGNLTLAVDLQRYHLGREGVLLPVD
ncbi:MULTISPECIES: MBL fold metallo-hydrolase [Pseudomonas]|uniref:MBL fold metallo-hydrolase n=1 Tax=Pseudomonas TaxID=286 RepID=UPI000F77580E|nr:MBL fold metallo-hydrolase [Pseudomonas fulva]MBA1208959.1 MBL fold metallo-hydrolase [Pseudomonas fulva]MBA1218283.1 MBL fold metallo-hydrolase [Pseudomonas fulva]MDH0573473.1 MBL fold metallo-hydrolase [Pseudomonas fulva]RRW59375.1 MBL fold metallo-hydrolase [Pseudomonas fulva]